MKYETSWTASGVWDGKSSVEEESLWRGGGEISGLPLESHRFTRPAACAGLPQGTASETKRCGLCVANYCTRTRAYTREPAKSQRENVCVKRNLHPSLRKYMKHTHIPVRPGVFSAAACIQETLCKLMHKFIKGVQKVRARG